MSQSLPVGDTDDGGHSPEDIGDIGPDGSRTGLEYGRRKTTLGLMSFAGELSRRKYLVRVGQLLNT